MPKVQQTSIHLSEWGLDMPALIVDGEGVYIPLKLLCFALMGTIDDRPHRRRVLRDPILSQLWRHMPVQTAGGRQEMFCLEHIGIARWIDRLDLEKVRADVRPRLLQLMWRITFAAHRLLTGEVESLDAGTIPAIIPASGAPVRVQDTDARHYLLALAERVGHIEIDARAMQRVLLALADTSGELPTMRCPQCGYALDGSEGEL